jgi:hypothetical protein
MIYRRYCVLYNGIPYSDIHCSYFTGRDFAVNLLVQLSGRPHVLSGIITLFFRLLSHPASRSILVSFLLPIAAAICSAVSPFCKISCNFHLITVHLSSGSAVEYFDASYNFLKTWKFGIHCTNMVLTPCCNTIYNSIFPKLFMVIYNEVY